MKQDHDDHFKVKKYNDVKEINIEIHYYKTRYCSLFMNSQIIACDFIMVSDKHHLQTADF